MDFDIDCKSEDQEQETNSKEVKTYRVTSNTRLLVKTLITVNTKEIDSEPRLILEKGHIQLTLKYMDINTGEVLQLNKDFPLQKPLTFYQPIQAKCEIRGPFLRVNLTSEALSFISVTI